MRWNEIKKIGFIGECMIELAYQHTELVKGFGGDTLNSAIYLKRACGNVDVSFITGIGIDTFSNEMVAFWEKEGIDSSFAVRDKVRLPGIYFIETDANGERKFNYWRNDSAAKYWLDSDNKFIEELFSFDAFYLSGISLAILPESTRKRLVKLLSQAKDKGKKIIFDNNYRPRLWDSKQSAKEAYENILKITNIAFLTADDDYLLFDESNIQEILDRTNTYGIEIIVIKQGSSPCLVKTGEQLLTVEATKVDPKDVIDTTAAGDSFSAGFLSSLISGADFKQSANFAHEIAAKVIQHKGALLPFEYFNQVIKSNKGTKR